MFINADLPTVYGLAQGTADLVLAQCWHCFQGIGELNRLWYDGREGGRVLGVRCSFRYEGYQFYAGTLDVRIGLHCSRVARLPLVRGTTVIDDCLFNQFIIIIFILEPSKSIISSLAHFCLNPTNFKPIGTARQPQLPLSFN
jgi:hypothetical protein